jgi:hypothetical protein
MSTGTCKSPGSRYWRELYTAALSEIGRSKLPERIAEAENAVVLRARELFHGAGDNGEETEALDDAMYALHALRSNRQMRQGPSESQTRPHRYKDDPPAPTGKTQWPRSQAFTALALQHAIGFQPGGIL